jgi:hypothetical protein
MVSIDRIGEEFHSPMKITDGPMVDGWVGWFSIVL